MQSLGLDLLKGKARTEKQPNSLARLKKKESTAKVMEVQKQQLNCIIIEIFPF